MQFVDSHAHLDRLNLTPYEGSLEKWLAACNEMKVLRHLCVGISLNDFPKVLAIATDYPEIYASVGVHPNEHCVDPESEPTLELLLQHSSQHKVVAIGETGLDYYRLEEGGDPQLQQQRFRVHIRAAVAANKPLIVHCREAKEDTLRILREEGAERVGGVMHCFVEDLPTAEAAMALGFYISFSGIVTFKSAEALQRVATEIPSERLLIETDSPYLAPVPYRGKSNYPQYVVFVAEALAQLRQERVEEIAKNSWNNFSDLFKLPRVLQSNLKSTVEHSESG
ncbi:MAG: TatD family hydrolase [Gammaproteobacteria bacterium]|nr:TatD family hydrolase [Gammaproteobacteria bacterium]